MLVDVELGAESGLELARSLAAADSGPQIVLVSAHPEEDLVDLLADVSAIGFLSKSKLSAAAILELVQPPG